MMHQNQHKNFGIKAQIIVINKASQEKLLFNEKETVRSLNEFPEIDFFIKECRKDTQNVHFYREKAT